MELKDFVSYFKLQNMPFTNRIGTEYLYKSDSIVEIQNKLQHRANQYGRIKNYPAYTIRTKAAFFHIARPNRSNGFY